MVIDRSKHNRYTTDAIYGNLTSGGIVTDNEGNVSGTEGLNYAGGIILIGNGGNGGISPELIALLTNQDAFSYLNVSDGINTANVEAKLEKDYINLNILGDNETVETKVSTEKYLPETFYDATGIKPGRYSVTYNKIVVPEISGGEPVEVTKWVITIKKIYGNPIFPTTDFNGVEILEEGNSLGAYALNSSKLTVTSDPVTGLQLIVILDDTQLNFTEIRLIRSEDYTTATYTTIVAITDIVILTFTTVLITQAGAIRYWKLDDDGKLYTEYDTYTTKTLGARDIIWSDKGYMVGNFSQGISGGIFHISDDLGTAYAEMDKLRVRKKAYFETLEIVNVNTVGGKLIISPAGAITIRKVEVYDTYYRCYFLGEQDGVEIENRFRVNDLAFSLNFNVTKPGNYEQVANHYYWRLVVGVSTTVDSDSNHYIDLSIINCDTNSDIPHVNDVVAQLGNTTDPDRQSAMIFSSVDEQSPRLMLCHGINTYTLNATNYFDLGVDHSINQAYMNLYGNVYIGAKDRSTYIDFSQTNGLNIKGDVSISSTYGGKAFSDIFVTTESLSDRVTAVVGKDLEFLLNQIDGNIDSYFYEYSPTLNNYPADTWMSEEDKQRHNGDTFTNIQEYVNDTETPDAGKSWRWVKNSDGEWGWIIISDSDAVAALKKAGEALDTADGKCKTFTRKPEVNDAYDIGDLWVNATYTDSTGLLLYSNDVLRANTAKKKGELFDISHWELASKYTDDKLAQDAKTKADAALAAADAAGTAANSALTSINDYKTEINDIFSDGVITTSERSRLNTLTDTIKTTLFDVLTTYRDVYNNKALNDKTLKTNLKTAYDAFSNSATVLLDTVSTIIQKDTITKGDVASVDQAYDNFNTDYTVYIGALGSANLEIMNTLSATAYSTAVDKYAWLNGLFDPSQKTEFHGGVVTTGILALGKKVNEVFIPKAGMSGVISDSYGDSSIAIWFGGDMLDKDNYTAGNRPDNVATSLLRYDGSGYLGYKPNSDPDKDLASIWWDSTGNIHANPLSFFVGPETVGLLLTAFHVVPYGSTTTPMYIEQKAPFTRVNIGNAYLDYDVVNNAVYVYTLNENGDKVACNFYAYGGVSALGFAEGMGSGSGLDVYAMWDVLGADGTELIHPSHISTALSTYATQSWVNELLTNVKVDTTNLVTIDTALTIIASKTFTSPIKVSITATTPCQEGLSYYSGSTIVGAIGAVHDGSTISYMQLNPKGILDGISGLIVGDELGFNGHLVFHSGNTVIPTVPNMSKYYTKTQSDGRYVGGYKFAAHGSQSTSYTADSYSTNFVNKAFQAFAERGSWSFADNGYITTSLGLNINLSGTAIFQWGGSDTHKTQLFITPANSAGVSNPALNEMLFYTSNGSGYDAGWTRVLTNRNYASELDSRYVNATGDTMTGRLQINTSSRYLKIGCENGTFAHYQTDAESGHWFNKNTYVAGNIYAGTNYNQLVWHQGNDGSGSGLDADLLDGLHSSSFGINHGEFNSDSTSSGTTSTSVTDLFSKINNTSSLFTSNFGFARGSWWFQGNTNYNTGVGDLNISGTAILNMSKSNDTTANYKTVLFIDRAGQMFSYVSQESGVSHWSRYTRTTDNIESANRLYTSHTIWGQTFNGTQNVSGNMAGVGAIGFSTGNEIDVRNDRFCFGITNQSEVRGINVGSLLVSNAWNDYTKVPANGAYIKGNVGIGATPTYKLDVSGTIRGTSIIIGDGMLVWDSANNGLYVVNKDGSTPAGFYATGYVSAKGMNTNSSDNNYMMFSRGDYNPNNLTDIGVREVYSSTNAPTNNAWHQYMTWGTADSGYTFQMANQYTANGRLYYRHKISGSWYSWRSVAELSDLTWGNIASKPTTLSGYGISDAYTKTESDSRYVTSLGTSGRYLTWTKNGNTNNIFVPFAENAMILWMENSSVGTNYIAVGNGNASSWSVQSIFIKAQCGIGVYNASDTCTMVLDASAGNISLKGQLWQSSDMRLKSNIQDLTFRGRLRPKSFIRNNRQEIGFIAQDVQAFYPELVVDSQDENHYLSLNYSAITAVLAVQLNNICDRTETLEEKVERLENENADMKKIIKELKGGTNEL